ncbi:16469_t:CDS:2, partial [Acaulospora colombiana]
IVPPVAGPPLSTLPPNPTHPSPRPNHILTIISLVENEVLELGFAGIIGFGPPSQSAIQRILPAGSGGGDQDGAAILSNLFGLGDDIAPKNRYFSVTLDRPGFEDASQSKNAWPSRLGIGKHVEEVEHAFDGLDDNINWLQLAQTSRGYTHWMTSLTDITVWKDGTPNQVNIGLGAMAVLDTG